LHYSGSLLGTKYKRGVVKIPFDAYDFFCFLASGLVVLAGFEVVFGFPAVMGQDLEIFDMGLMLIVIYVTGNIVSWISITFLENLVVGKMLGRPSENLFRDTKPFIRGLLMPGYYKTIEDPNRKRALERAGKEGVEGTGEPLFVHVRFAEETLANKKLIEKLDMFGSKYGFCRNMTLVGILVGIGILIKAGISPDSDLTKYGITSLVFAALLFYRYLSYYRLYSFEMFNVYGGLKKEKTKEETEEE
jgi:hypothetical protein